LDRFYQLIQDHHYDCASFFRVLPDFLVPFGIAFDPNEKGEWSTLVDSFAEKGSVIHVTTMDGFLIIVGLLRPPYLDISYRLDTVNLVHTSKSYTLYSIPL
jgi:hypothetical protein